MLNCTLWTSNPSCLTSASRSRMSFSVPPERQIILSARTYVLAPFFLWPRIAIHKHYDESFEVMLSMDEALTWKEGRISMPELR
jgi:hypothetical protein